MYWFQETLFHNGGEEWLGGYYEKLTNVILRAVERDLQDTHYLEKFKAFSERKALFEKVRYFTEKDDMRVINHGDSWAANFMFDATGALVKAIDFQITRNASLMLDLSTVIFACTTDEHRNNVGGVKGILHIYHDEICNTMTALGVAEPHVAEIPFERIHTMWRELGAFGLGNSIELVPLSMQEKDDFSDMDDAKGEEASTLEDMSHFAEITAPEKIKRLVDMIKLAVDDGLI
jgi:thiamine kinase-like enzyme